MDKAEFETGLRRDGFRVVNTSVKPNLVSGDLGNVDGVACHLVRGRPRQGNADGALAGAFRFQRPAGAGLELSLRDFQ